MNLQEFTSGTPSTKPWLDIVCDTLTLNTLTATSVNAGTIIASKVEAPLSLSNSFAYQVTTATYDPVAVNGAQSLYNGVLEFKNLPANACAITMPTASVLNTVIPTTQLDKCVFNLDLYNTSIAANITLTFSSALGVFNYKTNSNSSIVLVIPFSNVTSHMQLKFVRTNPGGFWTVYY
jgi:hypothetical protein